MTYKAPSRTGRRLPASLRWPPVAYQRHFAGDFESRGHSTRTCAGGLPQARFEAAIISGIFNSKGEGANALDLVLCRQSESSSWYVPTPQVSPCAVENGEPELPSHQKLPLPLGSPGADRPCGVPRT